MGNTTYRIIITIIDADRMPLAIYTKMGTIAPGGSNFVTYNHSISLTATIGTYTVRAMVWSDWLPDGVALSDMVEEVTFDVS